MEWIDTLLPAFLLILFRLTGFFLIAPYFSTRGVLPHFKIGLAVFLAILTVPMVGIGQVTFDARYPFLIIKELFVGFTLGFIASLFFYALQMAGGFIDLQMGFAFANIIDPQTGFSAPVMGNFKYMLGLLFLIATGGHHLLLRGILNSFFLIPLPALIPYQNGNIAEAVLDVFIHTFIISVQIAAPLVVSLFLMDVALGFITRTVPQLNIFVVGFPLKILASFAFLLILMPGFFFALKLLFSDLFQTLSAFTEQMVR